MYILEKINEVSKNKWSAEIKYVKSLFGSSQTFIIDDISATTYEEAKISAFKLAKLQKKGV